MQGVIDPRGEHRAAWHFDEQHHRLMCLPGSCAASNGDELACSSDHNRLEFVPWTGGAAQEE
jgi:hypothetical protein